MANCPNCGATITCGCQRKTASDGRQGCTQCIPAYEQALKRKASSRSSTSEDPSSQNKPASLIIKKDPRLN